MTDDAFVFTTLRDATGLPGTELAWPFGKAPSLPWFVYMHDRGGETFAENDNYHIMPRYRAELYIRENDPDLVKAFEDAVRSLGPFRHRESWIDNENCQMHSFTFTLTRKEKGA